MSAQVRLKPIQRIWLLSLLCVIGFIFNVFCFYPGAMGYDDAVTWARVRGAPTDDVGGVGLLLLWRVTENFIVGPAGPYLVELAFFWISLSVITNLLRLNVLGSVAYVIFVSAAPICFLALGRMGTDTALMAALISAFAALLVYGEKRNLRFLLVAAAFVLWSLMLRRNAMPAIIPLVVFGAWLHCREAAERRTLLVGVKSVSAILVFWLFAQLAFSSVDHKRTIFPATELWDLAAISADVGQVLLPSGTHGPALDVEDLKQAIEPYSNTTLFSRTRAGMKSPFLSPDNPLNHEILVAWTNAVFEHPLAYLRHRWQVTRGLFGTRPRNWPHELVYIDDGAQVGDNPVIYRNEGRLHRASIEAFERFRDTAIFSAWPYLLLILAFLILNRRLRPQNQMCANALLALSCSALLYALPFIVFAPSAELRYLSWPCLAATLGIGVLLISNKNRRAGGSEAR